MSKFGWIGRLFGDGAADPAPAPPPAPASAAVTIDYEDERVPAAAKPRIRRLLACLHQIEETLERETLQGFGRADIDQMRGQHLPRLVQSYIDIPADHRSDIFRKTGKSAVVILNESLDQMQASVDEILSGIAQKDIDKFTNNIKFVNQRYSRDDPFY